ncbi:MAG: hypothetical protein SGI92_00410 [Bryobacteraceae bacterium]|nr:hypothetical protein [Bryobacteraceae bacterium]
MGVVLTKAHRALIDEYGELERRLAEFKPVADRAAAVKKALSSLGDSHPADQPLALEGAHYTVHLSPKAIERKVFDIDKLWATIGKSKFLQFCRFPLAAIDQHVASSLHPAFLLAEHSGNRTVKAVAKASAVKKSKAA